MIKFDFFGIQKRDKHVGFRGMANNANNARGDSSVSQMPECGPKVLPRDEI